jgi:hypothetical protein
MFIKTLKILKQYQKDTATAVNTVEDKKTVRKKVILKIPENSS